LFQFYLNPQPASESTDTGTANLALKKCLRFATDQTEGEGWSEYTGNDWVHPGDSGGIVRLMDSNNVPRLLVIDRDDRKIWEHHTYDRREYLKSPPTDKDEADTGGTEIAWEKWGPEEVVSREHEHRKLEHDETHIYLRPDNTDNRGETGYDAAGIRSMQQISLEAYIDGEKTDYRSIARNVPDNGDIVFVGSKIENRRIQLVSKGTAGEARLTGVVHSFIAKMKAGGPTERQMSEDTNMLTAMDNLVVFVTRTDYQYDRVTKGTLTGGYSRVNGPDGVDSSGAILSADLELANAAVSGNYLITLWAKTTTPIPGESFTQFGETVNGWHLLWATGSVGLASDQVVSAGESVFDIRIFDLSSSISELSFGNSYYDDVTLNAGKAFLPFY